MMRVMMDEWMGPTKSPPRTRKEDARFQAGYTMTPHHACFHTTVMAWFHLPSFVVPVSITNSVVISQLGVGTPHHHNPGGIPKELEKEALDTSRLGAIH